MTVERSYEQTPTTDALERFVIWIYEQGYDARYKLEGDQTIVDATYALVGEYVRTHPP